MNFCDDPRQFALPPKLRKFKKRPRPPSIPKWMKNPKKWFLCKQPSWDVPNRTGEPIGLDVDGFKFGDAPIRWELAAAEFPVITQAKLLRKFYTEARWWRQPIAWNRDPEHNGQLMYSINTIVVMYGKRYSIEIERESMFGPHPARLFYRSLAIPTDLLWVAIVQIEGLWHSDQRLLAALNHEIRNRNFYQSPETEKQIVLQ